MGSEIYRKCERNRLIMGTILSCQCHGCNYREKLFVDGGLRDCDPEVALRAAPGDSALAKALREGASFRIDRDISACRTCKRLFVVPYVTYWPKDGEPRQTAVACPVCHKIITRFNYQLSNIPCPSCGKTLDLRPCGHWD